MSCLEGGMAGSSSFIQQSYQFLSHTPHSPTSLLFPPPQPTQAAQAEHGQNQQIKMHTTQSLIASSVIAAPPLNPSGARSQRSGQASGRSPISRIPERNGMMWFLDRPAVTYARMVNFRSSHPFPIMHVTNRRNI